MRQRWTALLLALCVLVCAGCGGGEQTQLTEDPLPEPEWEVIRSPKEDGPQDTPEEEPEDLEEEPLVWTTEPSLTAEEMPGSYFGLELPVQGATGYTSIELPLWASPEDHAAAQQALSDWEAQRQAAAEAEPALPEEGADAPEETDSGIQASLDVLSFSMNAPEDGEPPVSGETDVPQDPAADAPGEDAPSDTPPVQDEETPSAPAEEAADPAESPEEPPEETPEEPAEEPSPEPQLPEPEAAPQESEPSNEPEELVEPPALTDSALAILPPGTPMTVLAEDGKWWKVRCTAHYTTPEGNAVTGEVTGWVEHRYCFINLPDVIPSIIYNATNGYASRFISCGKDIDGITGEQLYTGKTFNLRLGEDEFMMPVLYSMSFLLCQAQHAALAEGNSLILYEGYRPLDTQLKVANGLRALMRVDPEVQTAITTKPWSIPWFIATSASNHQWGYAVDMSLARVKEVDVRQTGEYIYTRVIEYEEYTMPTPIHELSPAAATFTTAIGPNSATAWKSAKLTDTMAACEPALGLQRYCTGVGLSPLASEWWHFNDLASRASVLDHLGGGGFEITECLSEGPQRERYDING